MAKRSNKKKLEGLKSTLALNADLFKAGPSEETIFLIGFDTEYERESHTDPDEARSNRVLSYQYCGTIVSDSPTDADIRWSGIIYPKGPTVGDRLEIPEFIHTVIQEGLKAYLQSRKTGLARVLHRPKMAALSWPRAASS